MNDKKRALQELLNLINNAPSQSSDTIIANALYTHREQLDELSLEALADKYFVSQASISRFIKKLGYKSYSSFRNDITRSMAELEYVHRPVKERKDPEQICSQVTEQIINAVAKVKETDVNQMIHAVNLLHEYRNIYFFGSKLSVAIVTLLNHMLIAQGKNAYNILSGSYQNELLEKLTENDLLICISIEQRWYQTQMDTEKLKNCKAYKMLWTCDRLHRDVNIFDEAILFAKDVGSEIGYNSLMSFVMMIYRLYLNG
ncbi:MAG: MurR/RpiR family transcriptional regulator [Faecalicoccus sp.]|nr:MurR/RpiR family transcriptional regulator [Faecalicoccus sp.]